MFSRQSRSDIVFDVIVTFILVIVFFITLYPLVYVVSASLSDPIHVLNGEILFLPKGLNLNAYERVFQDERIMTGYRNTIMYTVVGTLVNVVMTIAGAYPLSRKDFKGRNLLMGLFTFTMFFNGGLIPTYMLIKSLHLVNSFWVMIIPGAVQMWNLIIMRTFFQTSIPQELYESSFLDGCSNIKALTKIVLPLSTPIIAVISLFYCVAHWNAFFNALIYLSDKNRYPLQLVLRQILIQSEMQAMMDSGSESMGEQMLLAEGLKYAVIIVSSLPVLMLYPLVQRYFVKGVMVGAIKG